MRIVGKEAEGWDNNAGSNQQQRRWSKVNDQEPHKDEVS